MATKRLYLDIETSLMSVATFSLRSDQYISHDNIIEDWHIICAAWKWEGQEEVFAMSTYTNNDKKVTAALREVICQADEIVYHNGTKFDYKKLNARVILNGLPPMTKPRETDTLTQCRKHFAFTSNRLDYIGKVLGVGGKIHTESGLWLRALKKDRQAIDAMLEYNRRDVVLLEDVFNILRPHITLGFNPNINSLVGDICTNCESSNLEARGWHHTKTAKTRKWRCRDCGAWPISTKSEPKTGGGLK